MSFVVAMQEAIDIAFHMVTDEGWGVPGSYADAFLVLAEHGVVVRPLAESLARMVALRNRIAHGYTSVDIDRLWTELPAGLEALDDYAGAVARFLPSVSGAGS
jgi:uncharacterized protein YutE (UPF0331/DUF86 family)